MISAGSLGVESLSIPMFVCLRTAGIHLMNPSSMYPIVESFSLSLSLSLFLLLVGFLFRFLSDEYQQNDNIVHHFVRKLTNKDNFLSTR